MHHPIPVYTAHAVKAWESRWFAAGNSSFGLMQQAALVMANVLKTRLSPAATLCIWCGSGNNGGDGYLLAAYLADVYRVQVYQTAPPSSADAKRAYQAAVDHGIHITDTPCAADVHIDAIFGNGLDRPLTDAMIDIVRAYNAATGQKIAIDIPTGLHPDTGMPLPICMSADLTLCLMAYKAGLLMGHAKSHVGEIICLPLIPTDSELISTATIDNTLPTLPTRAGRGSHQHKGDFGSVMVIGGSSTMGGAAIMSAEAAIRVGAGRVTVMTHEANHPAIIARLPNLMLGDIELSETYRLSQMSAACIGMGFGRNDWSARCFDTWLLALVEYGIPTVLDADGLWHLAQYQAYRLPDHIIGTPHHAEAARLLDIHADEVEADRIAAIRALRDKFGGQWLLKGANSLTIDHTGTIRICTLGNAAMATAGMGDVLAGMMAGILAQAPDTPISQIVALHAHCGDLLSGNHIAVDVNEIGKTAARILKGCAV